MTASARPEKVSRMPPAIWLVAGAMLMIGADDQRASRTRQPDADASPPLRADHLESSVIARARSAGSALSPSAIICDDPSSQPWDAVLRASALAVRQAGAQKGDGPKRLIGAFPTSAFEDASHA
jgi:hypothetical protein